MRINKDASLKLTMSSSKQASANSSKNYKINYVVFKTIDEKARNEENVYQNSTKSVESENE